MDAKSGTADTTDESYVSIHAPVMDAKWIALLNGASSPVSIHAPVMDAKRWLLW